MSARFVVSKTDAGIPDTKPDDTENVEIIVENKELGMLIIGHGMGEI